MVTPNWPSSRCAIPRSRTCAARPSAWKRSGTTTKPPEPSTRHCRSFPTTRPCCRSAPRPRCCRATTSEPRRWPGARSRPARGSARCAGVTGRPSRSRGCWKAMRPAPPQRRRRSRPAPSPGSTGTEMTQGSAGDDEGALAGRSRAALAEGGTLAAQIPAFAPRPAQQDLAAAVADVLDARGTLLAEAGTGTGKTFAYLVPALLSGLKTIVSTGTRALQDQLYHRDLPRVRDALGAGIRTALLKGRANYLCLYRMERAKGEPRFSSREQIGHFQRIVAWAGRTRMGDLAELDGLPDDSPLLPMVTSTAENCLGSECPFWSDCFVVQARQRAQNADVVVVNHHLLLADLALKQEGFGEILPGAQAFVVDEAHQLPDLAAQFFGESLSARPLAELGRDALAECKEVEGSLAVVQQPARDLEHATRALRAAMEGLPPRGT